MPRQSDPNTGRCIVVSCDNTGMRCDGFMCFRHCVSLHQNWANHRRVDGPTTPPFVPHGPDPRLPAVYGGPGGKRPHSELCKCHSCEDWGKKNPPEYDYDGHPVDFGEAKELDDDYPRVFVPLSNFQANKDWPADYVG